MKELRTFGGIASKWSSLAMTKPTTDSSSNCSISDKKLFIGGLNPETSDNCIYNYFGKFGEVKSVQLIFDKVTNQSRRFGFVIMNDESSISKILKLQPHFIKNKQIECKRALPKSSLNCSTDVSSKVQEQLPKVESNGMINRIDEVHKRKLFIGGLGRTLTEREIVEYFIVYGEIQECFIKRQNNVSRGFGFLIFKSEISVHNVMKNLDYKKILIKNTEIECKIAVPRQDILVSNQLIASTVDRAHNTLTPTEEAKEHQNSGFNEKLLFLSKYSLEQDPKSDYSPKDSIFEDSKSTIVDSFLNDSSSSSSILQSEEDKFYFFKDELLMSVYN